MKKISNPAVAEKFQNYPIAIRKKLMAIRQMILDTVSELDVEVTVEETLKWGEPSFVSKIGSTIRIDWKRNSPDNYYMYFNCRTKLIDTFKEIYDDKFIFEGNRAIVFKLNDKIPVNELKHCIKLALTYKQIKHLPLLGV